MGNYRNVETDFIERTLRLIAQYEVRMKEYDFEEQFNHTLLINCLLGLIVFPKEKHITFLPKYRIADVKLKKEMGIEKSTFNQDYKYFDDLIHGLRNSVAHFDILFHSDDEQYLIDRIIFKDSIRDPEYVVADFVSEELLAFVRYYADWLLSNLRSYGKK